MTIGVAAMTFLFAACSGEPASQVAIPGAPAGGDTRPPASTVAPADGTDVTGPSSSQATTTVPSTASTTVAPPTTITSTSTSTTIAPTTTQLVYAPESADGALQIGSEGPRSLKLQQDLILLAYLPASGADGKYGPGTAGGIRRFQQAEGLVVDGVAGPKTLQAMDVAITEANAISPVD